MKKFLAIVLLVVYLEACSPARTILPTSNPLTTEPAPTFLPKNASLLPWWTQAVFYEIFVRSFNDSNGDGIGDFNGITQKLDYLKDLGVTAIWLMPIHPSPSYHGYDVINYFAVNMDYGTQDDFKLMLDEAHRRGMRVIIDLVVNHTSNQNPVFIEANNNPQSPYRNWYIWSDTDPGTSGLNGPAWHAGKFGYYYGIFGANMPDLNYTNPEVTTFMEKVARYWLTTVGLDGFRLDAPKYLIEEDKKLENTGSTHVWFQNFYTAYKADKPDAYTVGEIYGAGAFLAKTYTGDQFDQVFNFEMASGFVNSAAGEANSGVDSAIKFMLKDLPGGQFATFLTNHDQNRVMSTLNGNADKAKVAAALMFTAPGTPFIYYGEEIGMQGKKPDEDIRLPMQWSAQTNAGFSSGTPWRTPAADYPQVNVASESSNPDSLLSFYKELIALRQAHSALQGGKIALISNENPGVYSILRSDRDEVLMVLINLTKAAITNYDLSLQNAGLADGQHSLGVLYGNGTPAALTIASQGFSRYKPLEELPAYSVSIFKIKP